MQHSLKLHVSNLIFLSQLQAIKSLIAWHKLDLPVIMSHIFRMCFLIKSIVCWHVFSSAIPISFVSFYKRYCWVLVQNCTARRFLQCWRIQARCWNWCCLCQNVTCIMTKTNLYQSGHKNTEMLNLPLGERAYSFPSEFIFKIPWMHDRNTPGKLCRG